MHESMAQVLRKDSQSSQQLMLFANLARVLVPLTSTTRNRHVVGFIAATAEFSCLTALASAQRAADPLGPRLQTQTQSLRAACTSGPGLGVRIGLKGGAAVLVHGKSRLLETIERGGRGLVDDVARLETGNTTGVASL